MLDFIQTSHQVPRCLQKSLIGMLVTPCNLYTAFNWLSKLVTFIISLRGRAAEQKINSTGGRQRAGKAGVTCFKQITGRYRMSLHSLNTRSVNFYVPTFTHLKSGYSFEVRTFKCAYPKHFEVLFC